MIKRLFAHPMKITIIFLFCLISLYNAQFPEDNGVIVLDENNYSSALSSFQYTFIEFYYPGPTNQRINDQYSEAAKQLSGVYPGFRFCKLDAKSNRGYVATYGITEFPSFKLFIKSKATPIDYTGKKTTADFVDYIKTTVEGFTRKIDTLDEAIKLINENKYVGLYIGSFSSEAYEVFLGIVSAATGVVFLRSDSEELKNEFSPGNDGFIFSRDFNEESNMYIGTFTLYALSEFINVYMYPPVMPFKKETITRIFDGKKDGIFLIKSAGHTGGEIDKAFETVADKYRNKIAFSSTVYDDPFGQRLTNYFSLTAEDVPLVQILQSSNKNKKYRLDREINVKTLEMFLLNFFADNLHPFLKSEEIPKNEYDGDVRIVVGKNSKDLVYDNTKHVILEFYSPTCDRCKRLAPIYSELATSYKNDDDFVFAKIDGSLNDVDFIEVEAFPAVYLFPKNNKDKPVILEKMASLDDLKRFVVDHTVTMTDM